MAAIGVYISYPKPMVGEHVIMSFAIVVGIIGQHISKDRTDQSTTEYSQPISRTCG